MGLQAESAVNHMLPLAKWRYHIIYFFYYLSLSIQKAVKTRKTLINHHWPRISKLVLGGHPFRPIDLGRESSNGPRGGRMNLLVCAVLVTGFLLFFLHVPPC